MGPKADMGHRGFNVASEGEAHAMHFRRCALKPLDRDDIAAGRLDPRDSRFDRLDHRRHVMGVGVNHGGGVVHDGDVSLPEDQVAAQQAAPLMRLQRAAEAGLLHVAVARAAGA